MAKTVTFYVESFAWNGNTFDCDDGGPLELTIKHNSELIEDRSGCDFYSTFVEAVNGMLSCTLRVRTVFQPLDLGEKSDGSAALHARGSTVDIPLPGLVLYDVDMDQGRAAPGEAVLSFKHESEDGQTNPLAA